MAFKSNVILYLKLTGIEFLQSTDKARLLLRVYVPLCPFLSASFAQLFCCNCDLCTCQWPLRTDNLRLLFVQRY